MSCSIFSIASIIAVVLLSGCDICFMEMRMSPTSLNREAKRECKPEMQRNGLGECGYIVSLWQLVNYTQYLHAPGKLVMPSPPPAYIQREGKQIQDFMSPKLRSKTNSLVITTIERLSKFNTQYNISYDVYCKNSNVSPADFAEDFKRVKTTFRKTPGNGKMFTGWKAPRPQWKCTPKVIGHREMIFQFGVTDVGEVGHSTNSCYGQPMATISCISKKYQDNSFRVLYDYNSLYTNQCEQPEEIDEPETKNLTSEGDWVNRMNSLLTVGYARKSDSAQSALDFVRKGKTTILGYSEFVENKSMKISENALKVSLRLAETVVGKNSDVKEMEWNEYFSSPPKPESMTPIAFAVENLCNSLGEEATFYTKYMHIQVQQIHINSSSEGLVFSGTLEDPLSTNKDKMHAFLPGEAIQQGTNETSRNETIVSFILFKNEDFFYTSQQTDFNFNQVVSVSVNGAVVRNLEDPLKFEMPVGEYPISMKNQVRLIRCAYLDEQTEQWLSNGCSFVPNSNPPLCSCNHLTNFAVLVKDYNFSDPYSLQISGTVGCSLSIAGLVLTLICSLSLSSLRKLVSYKIHCHLGFCLLAVYIIFVALVERTQNHGGCIAIAALLQFCLLSAWGWMTVECITMYWKLVHVLGDTGCHYVTKSAIIIYFTSATIVGVNLVIAVAWFDNVSSDWVRVRGNSREPSTYISERLCWLHGYSLIFGFLFPVAIALLINIFGFIIVIKAITCDRAKVRSSRSSDLHHEVKTYLLRAITLSVLFGLGWIFAIPLALTDDELTNTIFGWLFTIANALQGFFIFIFFCVKNENIRELWLEKLKTRIRSIKNRQNKQDTMENSTV